jgi:hypothetical protein
VAPRTEHFFRPERVLSDARVFVNAGTLLETTLVGVYLAATAARHAASEAAARTCRFATQQWRQGRTLTPREEPAYAIGIYR